MGIERWLSCPECGSGAVAFSGRGYRENPVECQTCGFTEGGRTAGVDD